MIHRLGGIDIELAHVLCLGQRVDVVAFHEGADLSWHLLEDLLGEVASCNSLVVLDELDDITGANLPL